jgi:hypothetical protein
MYYINFFSELLTMLGVRTIAPICKETQLLIIKHHLSGTLLKLAASCNFTILYYCNSCYRFVGAPDGYKYDTINLYQHVFYGGVEQYTYGDASSLNYDNLGRY